MGVVQLQSYFDVLKLNLMVKAFLEHTVVALVYNSTKSLPVYMDTNTNSFIPLILHMLDTYNKSNRNVNKDNKARKRFSMTTLLVKKE